MCMLLLLLVTVLKYAFSALTLLVGWQEGHKNWVVRCWHDYLSGARCKWFAYGPADATATPSSLVPVKSRMVYLSGAGLARLSWKKRPLNGCSSSSSNSIEVVVAAVFVVVGSIGSRPSDHYFRSVCWFVCLFVCLCRVFLSRLWSDFDQTRTYVICLGLIVSLRIWGLGNDLNGGLTPKKLVFLGVLWLKKLSHPTVLIGLSWFLVIL